MESQAKPPKLLDQVRDVLRLHHYSIHTERTYLDWIKRYIQFHQMRSREDLGDVQVSVLTIYTAAACSAPAPLGCLVFHSAGWKHRERLKAETRKGKREK